MKKVTNSFFLLISLVLLGCSDGMESVNSANNQTAIAPPFVSIPPGPFVPPGVGVGLSPGPDVNTWAYGAAAPIELEGSSQSSKIATLSDYAFSTRYQPENLQVNINFQKIGNNWGGTVTVYYTDWDGPHIGYFTTGGSQAEVVFNVWYNQNGKQVFHAVLEDFRGGLVITIDDYLDLGDGNGPESATGTIWYKNFELTSALHPPTRCWFVNRRENAPTPYDCRPWPVDSAIPSQMNNAHSSVDPWSSSGYKRLGRFTGLDVEAAFNGDLTL